MIRELIDAEGRRWDVTVGRESYGILVLLFAPSCGEGVRKAMLASSTRLEALQELAELSDEELVERLRQSQPWDTEGWGPAG